MKRADVVPLLSREFPDQPALVAEYVREAEHQEGRAYWRQFKPSELVEDARLYFANAEETKNA